MARILRFGSIPVIWQAEDPRAALDAYVQLYVREEVRAEALVRNLPGFLRFLPAAGLFHGQVINTSGLARDAATARKTVEGYLGILQDTLLATLVPAFEARLRVRERRHPNRPLRTEDGIDVWPLERFVDAVANDTLWP